MVSAQKSLILRPLYNRYFCHITIIKWSRTCQNSTGKYFFVEIFFNETFYIKFTIKAVRAKVKDGSKMVSKVIFLDLMTFLMDIIDRPKKILI